MSRGFWLRVWRGAWLAVLGGGVDVASLAVAEGFTHPAARSMRVTEGELLLGELNCVACHAAPAAVVSRLDSRGAPVLGAAGLPVTPQWVRRWLADPAAAKPGSGMPHLLAGLPADQRAEAVEALTHFLTSMAPTHAVAVLRADPARVETGKALYHSVGCVACHAPVEKPEGVTDEVLVRAHATAVPLGDLATKYPAGALARFLQDPVKFRPGGRMPSLGLSDSEAASLATYLVREQLTDAGGREPAAQAGLQYEYFEGPFGGCAEFATRQPAAVGDVPTVDAKVASRPGNFGLRFQGVITAPTDGDYTFWINSDDGSQLYLDGVRLIDNDGVHPPVERSAKRRLPAGPHSFLVLFYQNGGGYELDVRWEGPGIERQVIPATAFTHFVRPLTPKGHEAFAVDATQAARGREWFGRLNCAACHAVEGILGTPAKPLLELAGRSTQGCLADSVPAGVPKFELSVSQREALRTAVRSVTQLRESLEAVAQVAHTMSRLNCYACHVRDETGGPQASGRADWFRMVSEVDLGDEGRMPPHLNAVGAKLRPEWLGRLLEEGTKVRPYMATRMPRFGELHARRLKAAFVQADERAEARPEPTVSARDAKAGWKLVGRDGMNCIACHTFSTFGSTGIPALALDTLAQRVRWDWFRRYLPDPAALRPGTRMPTFWPEGRSVQREILGGDTEAQIQALWAWLRDGSKAEVPAGLVRGRRELVVENEPVIYRHFIAGAGSRAIGVGYPEHANLAFDANELRMALLWQGSFIDTARHSTDRGEGYEPPLGDHPIKLPGGPSFAVLADAAAVWPGVANRLSGVNRFLGYTLDAGQRPTFRYRIGGVTLEETPKPRVEDVDMTLVRRFKLSGQSEGPFYFRAATGEISRGDNGEFVVDRKLRLRFSGAGTPIIVGAELRVPVTVPGEFTVEMTW